MAAFSPIRTGEPGGSNNTAVSLLRARHRAPCLVLNVSGAKGPILIVKNVLFRAVTAIWANRIKLLPMDSHIGYILESQ